MEKKFVVKIKNLKQNIQANEGKKEIKTLTWADAEYQKEHHYSCKKLKCDENFSKECVGKFIYNLYQIIKIVVPIIIVIMGNINLIKALMEQNGENIKK